MKLPVALLLGLLLFLQGHLLCAQKTYSNLSDEQLNIKAQEHFSLNRFATAYELYSELCQRSLSPEKQLAAQYQRILCAMKLELPEFELLMSDFVHKNALHPLALGLRNYSADYYFAQGNYKKVIELQQDMPLEKARTEDDIKAIYQLAYSYFTQNNETKAKEYFDLICKGEHSYLHLANYYAGYIAYKQESYDEALEKLGTAAEGESFKQEANLLIPTIYYQQEQYNKAFRFLKELDENGEKLSENQLLVAAESAYAAEKYAEAAHYFSLYSKGGKKVLSRPLYYRIGYSYSMSKNAKESIPYFNKAADGNDSLCQISAYQLGVAYMDMGDKQLAVGAFDKCKKLNFDPKIQETGAYSSAKVLFDLQQYEQCIAACDYYTKTFPSGPNLEDIYAFVSESHVNSGNYDKAMDYLERIKNKSQLNKQAYQRIAYNKAALEFNDNKFTPAATYFHKSLKYPVDRKLSNSAYYWMGEMHYMKGNYDSVVYYFNKIDPETDEYILRLYTLGYIFYNQKKYPDAMPYFRAFLEDKVSPNPKFRQDAALRLADCLYAIKNYSEAINAYNLALRLKNPEADYILYQKGNVYYANQETENASTCFVNLVSDYPKSRYVDLALFRAGMMNLETGNEQLAADHFSQLISHYPHSEAMSPALLKRGTIMVGQQNYAQAQKDFKQILDDYPTSEEAEDAILSLLDMQNKGEEVLELEVYQVKFQKSNPNSLATIAGDFENAKKPYYDENYAKASITLKSFIDRYPSNALSFEAMYYLGISLHVIGDTEQALAMLDKVQGDFHLKALRKSCSIEFELKHYEKASEKFFLLKESAHDKKSQAFAVMGLLESAFELGNYNDVYKWAEEIEQIGQTKDKRKTELLIGKSLAAEKKFEESIDHLLKTVSATDDEVAAEAQYTIGWVLREQDEFESSTQALIETTKTFQSYPKWVYRAYLLMAENFIDQDNLFQAKATLSSLVENCDEKKISDQAANRLNQLEEITQMQQDSLKKD